MSYVQRDGQGEIVAITRWPIEGKAPEVLADDHADVVAFIDKVDTRLEPAIGPTPQEIASGEIAAAKDLDEVKAALVKFFEDTTPKASRLGLLEAEALEARG